MSEGPTPAKNVVMSSPDASRLVLARPPQSLLQRVGDQERTAVCEELSAQFALGRLDPAELEHRLSAAITAQTRRDLGLLLGDLPPLERAPQVVPDRPSVPRSSACRSSWSGLDVVALLVVLGCSLVALLGVLVLSTAGLAFVVVATASTLTAGIGSAAAVHLGHRSGQRASAARRLEPNGVPSDAQRPRIA